MELSDQADFIQELEAGAEYEVALRPRVAPIRNMLASMLKEKRDYVFVLERGEPKAYCPILGATWRSSSTYQDSKHPSSTRLALVTPRER